jgi:hypothetical protein
MIATQRRALILYLLQQHGVVTIADICAHCNCSPETARRDLRQLEVEGELARTHGGATVNAAAKSSLGPERHGRLTTPPGNGPNLLEARIALTNRVDALVVTPSQTRTAALLVDRCRRAAIPVIAEATHLPGVHTVVSVDNYKAGQEAGRWAERELWAPAFQANEVGATGSGDASIAGFWAALLRNLSPEETIIAATAVGACNVEAADALSGILNWPATQARVRAGWPKHDLVVKAAGWRYDSSARLWIGGGR